MTNHPNRNKVITWQAPNGATIDLTPRQERQFREAGEWPRNESGEYCQVSHGLHSGSPSFAGLAIGDHVEGGMGEDHDTGRIVSLMAPPQGDCDVVVVWDSGVRTPAVSADLAEVA